MRDYHISASVDIGDIRDVIQEMDDDELSELGVVRVRVPKEARSVLSTKPCAACGDPSRWHMNAIGLCLSCSCRQFTEIAG